MNALLEEVKNQARTGDDNVRRAMLDQLRELADSLEQPEDTMQRVLYLNLHIATIKVGIDLKIFNLLAKVPHPQEFEQLAKAIGTDPVLLGRILRHLASTGMIKEVAKGTFAANNITRTLAIEENQSGVYHNTVGPMYQDLPTVLAEKGYENLADNTQTVFNKTWQTDLPGFIWFQQHPEKFHHFNKFMQGQREGMPTWLTVYPVQEETKGWDAGKAVFVDVGGGFGHQCAAFRNKYPDLRGQIILQDVPQAIANAMHVPGVELMEHDFFQPQPVKGAKYYYLRNILHDYSDDKCLAILRNLKVAMTGSSVILIDDMVLPDYNASWRATQIDLTMMVGLGSMERTEEQWQALLSSAGMKITKIYTYNASIHDCVIVAVPGEA
ncbi:MAG: hypothetical protein Q9191_000465 [Dirinaria sp. TL-2023a]